MTRKIHGGTLDFPGHLEGT